MRWKLFANLAETASDDELDVDIAGREPTVGDALDALLDAHPELRSEVLDDHGDIYDHVRLLHEGTDPFLEGDGLETTLDEDDELALFPPVSGG